jgi:hypothetical protein
MEFGANSQAGSPEISDAQRIEAGSRIHLVEPAHAGITPDDLSDGQVITQHVVRPAVANAANDTEYTPGDDAINMRPAQVPRVILLVSVSISLILAALLIYVFLVLV